MGSGLLILEGQIAAELSQSLLSNYPPERPCEQHAVMDETKDLDVAVLAELEHHIVPRLAYTADLRRDPIAAMRDVIDAKISLPHAAPVNIGLTRIVRNVAKCGQHKRGIALPSSRAEMAFAPIQDFRKLRLGAVREAIETHDRRFSVPPLASVPTAS